MMGVRAQQKEKTRRSLVEAAFSQLSAERSFASLSLREVAREAGIAPTSFYRHFRDVDELGLTMVDESGLMLRQLMRQARREYPQLDGIFCTNDDLAVGAAFECQRLGLKIPDDMAIAGFHGHDIGQVMEPRLASVLSTHERMGRIGAERLLARIRGEAITPKMLDLGFTLSPGGSI